MERRSRNQHYSVPELDLHRSRAGKRTMPTTQTDLLRRNWLHRTQHWAVWSPDLASVAVVAGAANCTAEVLEAEAVMPGAAAGVLEVAGAACVARPGSAQPARRCDMASHWPRQSLYLVRPSACMAAGPHWGCPVLAVIRVVVAVDFHCRLTLFDDAAVLSLAGDG